MEFNAFVKRKFMLFPPLFFIGFGLPYLSLVAFFISIVVLFDRFVIKKPKLKVCFSYFLVVLFCLVVYVFFGNNLTIYHCLTTFILIFYTVTIFFFYLHFDFLASKGYIDLICYFVFGVFLKNFVIVVYSFYYGGLGYSKLYDPIKDVFINSPGVGDALGVSFGLLLNLPFVKVKFFKSILLMSIFFAGIYTGGRTFMILIGVSFFIYIYSAKMKTKILLSFFVCVFLILSIYFYSDVFFHRFSQVGLSSPRFSMLLDGLSKVAYYPFGGFGLPRLY